MELESERLYLRMLTLEDACDLYEIYRHPSVVRWLRFPRHVDVEETLSGIAACLQACAQTSQPAPFVIVEKQSERLIGTIDLHHPSSAHTMEIGYVLHPHWQGQGYMSEALACMLDYGFETLGLHRMNALCAVNNTASIALLHRFRFQREGQLAKRVVLGDGRSHALALYSLMREKWRNRYDKTTGSQIRPSSGGGNLL